MPFRGQNSKSSPKLSALHRRSASVITKEEWALPHVPRLHGPAPHPVPSTVVSNPELNSYLVTVEPPPFPVSEELAATSVGASSPSTVMLEIEDTVLADISKALSVTRVIWYSWFKTSAVILPPREAAPLKITKSFVTAP